MIIFMCAYHHAAAAAVQVAGTDQMQADIGSLAARVALLEEQQQQMSLAAQSGEASAALLEMQPTVKNRCDAAQMTADAEQGMHLIACRSAQIRKPSKRRTLKLH
jgi:hypothetical protein